MSVCNRQYSNALHLLMRLTAIDATHRDEAEVDVPRREASMPSDKACSSGNNVVAQLMVVVEEEEEEEEEEEQQQEEQQEQQEEQQEREEREEGEEETVFGSYRLSVPSA